MINVEGLKALYVGSSTGNQVLMFYVEGTSLLLRDSVVVGLTPSWLTYDGGVLYTTNEQNGAVASLTVSLNDGSLNFVNRVSSSGVSPTYITTAPSGNYVLAANYGTGSDVVIATNKNNGILGRITDLAQHNGSGPVPGRQDGPHAHQIIFDPSGKFAYSPDLGADKIYQYRFTEADGKLVSLAEPFVSSDPGDGPRHLAFHPNGKYAYLACELGSVVIAFKTNNANGELIRFQRVPTLVPPQAANYPAEIIIYPNGKFAYVSNRGNNSISIFKISEIDGTLTLMDVHSVMGAYPRGMVLDSSANIIYTMNQNSGTITIHSLNPQTGLLHYQGIGASGLPTPVCGYLLPIGI